MDPLSKRDDRGESLIELLVALAVMATAVIALLGALATAIRVSQMHRDQATTGAFMREFAERLESEVAENPAQYRECRSGDNDQALKSHYENLWNIPVPDRAGYSRQVVKVTYWDASDSRYEGRCPSSDYGVQLVSLRVSTVPKSGRPTVTETLDITLRKPCRAEDPACA